jgi:hypothetical protein
LGEYLLFSFTRATLSWDHVDDVKDTDVDFPFRSVFPSDRSVPGVLKLSSTSSKTKEMDRLQTITLRLHLVNRLLIRGGEEALMVGASLIRSAARETLLLRLGRLVQGMIEDGIRHSVV